MKRLSRAKLVEKILSMHLFMGDLEHHEIIEATRSSGDILWEKHNNRAEVFKFVREYIQSNFRPLV